MGNAASAISPSQQIDDDWAKVGLNSLRFAFALVVVLAHLSQPLFQTSWPDLTRYALMAVGGFFVLSGYTIKAVTPSPEGFDVVAFLIDRASRLLSVSLFALVLTMAADTASAWLAPAFYADHFGASLSEPLIRIFANVFLVSQLYGQDIAPFSNSPFWSLSYEAGFYVIWAALMHWRLGGGSVVWLLAAVVFYGPNVLFMLPFWLLGTVLFQLGRLKPWPRTLLSLGVMALVLLFMGLRFTAAGAHGMDLMDESLKGAIESFFSSLGISAGRVRISIILAAVKIFLLLIPVLHLADRVSRKYAVPALLAKVARRLRDVTFPLYLVHFPLLVLASSGKWFNPRSGLEICILVMVLLIAANVVATVADSFKFWMRGSLRHALLKGRAAAPSV